MSSPTQTDRIDADRSTTTEAPAPRRLFRGQPIWFVVALQIALMLGTMLLYPTFQNPDEIAHVDYVLAHRDGDWIHEPGRRFYQDGVLFADAMVPHTQFRSHVGGLPVVKRSARRSFDALGTGHATGNLPNQMVQHPSLYYAAAAGFTFLIPSFSDQNFDVQVFWLRMFSLILLIPVPLLIYASARRLTGGNEAVSLVAALIPLSMPVYLRTGGSVTNDALAVLLGIAIMYALARVVTGDLSLRTAAGLGLLWAGALLTKGLALVLPPVIVLAYVVATRGSVRHRVSTMWRPLVLAGAVGGVLGGWWWLRNLVAYGAVQPNGLGPVYGPRQFGPDRPGGTELKFLGNVVRLFALRAWGTLGLLDVPSMPHWIPFAAVVLFVVAVGYGLYRGFPAATQPCAAAVVLLLPVLLTIATIYVGTRPDYLRTTLLPGLQVRYLLPFMTAAMVLAASTVVRVARRIERWIVLTVAAFVLVFVTTAAWVVLDQAMSPNVPGRVARLRGALKYVLGWSPWSPPITAAVIAVGAGIVVVALTGLAVTAGRYDRAERDRPLNFTRPVEAR